MKTRPNRKKPYHAPEKAVVPDKGAAAFFCSTGSKRLSCKTLFPTVSQHPGTIHGIFDNLLPETHYFRRRLAERPLADVVLTEGQRTSLEKYREVIT